MSKLKVMIVVGTRPEIIRLSRVINAVQRDLHLTLVHTGQNYDFELNEIFFQDLGIPKPDHFLDAAGANAATTIGNTIAKFDEVLAKCPADAVLVLGDTNSCLAAISAKRRKIPVFHMEAGNRCFDQRVPEEINRKIVDHISDINMTYSDIAREYLLREGIPPDRVIKTGSPMFEVLNHYRDKIQSSDVLARLGLDRGEYFVVSAHREENIDSERNFGNLVRILNQVADQYGKPIVFSAHPRTQKKIESKEVEFDPLVNLMKPLGFTDFISLQKDALAVLSDSGTISEESSILNFPALNIREAHERPEAMEEASVVMTGLNPERVFQTLKLVAGQPRGDARLLRNVSDYSMPNVSDKVVRILLSYTDYINRVVWKKYN
ncbi:non-hydrolyzing UDP-N-acetylglucosamine 2-epimerase [Novipirellula sp. SH528]|uniref:non-hydrolyzing UDP-N-acetylglucosamine 2-epimerase n=1 Tax=Novipirellula sp. SH528 TaxID=3454466 RepID=UPI003F9FB10C